MKYTEEQTKEMLEIYQANPTRETVEMLADKYEKSMKSVIGKLAKEGVYRKETYVSKTGEEVITKPELVEQICAKLEVEELPGLEKAPKLTLKKLLAVV